MWTGISIGVSLRSGDGHDLASGPPAALPVRGLVARPEGSLGAIASLIEIPMAGRALSRCSRLSAGSLASGPGALSSPSRREVSEHPPLLAPYFVPSRGRKPKPPEACGLAYRVQGTGYSLPPTGTAYRVRGTAHGLRTGQRPLCEKILPQAEPRRPYPVNRRLPL